MAKKYTLDDYMRDSHESRDGWHEFADPSKMSQAEIEAADKSWMQRIVGDYKMQRGIGQMEEEYEGVQPEDATEFDDDDEIDARSSQSQQLADDLGARRASDTASLKDAVYTRREKEIEALGIELDLQLKEMVREHDFVATGMTAEAVMEARQDFADWQVDQSMQAFEGYNENAAAPDKSAEPQQQQQQEEEWEM